MVMFRRVAVCLLTIAVLCFMPVTHASVVDLQVYKGELRIIVPGEQARNLLIRYRSKTREVVRIAISGLTLTNNRTKEVIRLHDQSASLLNRIDQGGYWNTDISFSDLDLDNDGYQIEGMLTLYLVGSQRTQKFSVSLKSESSTKPPGSSIDWGVGD